MTPHRARDLPPPSGPARPFAPPAFRRLSTSGGLELILAPRDGAPLVEALLLLPAGGELNPLERSGLSALTAALVDEGTHSRTGLELATSLEQLGAGLATGADWDAARLSVSALTESFDEALAALAEIAREPSFPAQEVERVRSQTLAEIQRRPDHPARMADCAFAAALYPGSPFGELLQGSAASVASIARDEIVEFHAAHYRPQGGHLVVGGAFDVDRAEDLLRRRFDSWTGVAPARSRCTPPRRDEIIVHIVDLPRAAQTELRLGHLGVPRVHPERTRLGVLNALLGGKFTSRLNLNLRERNGFTYGVSSRFVDRHGTGPFVVATSVATGVAGAAVAEILAELRRLRAEPVAASELEETKRYLLGVFPYGFQTVAGQVRRLADLALYGLPDDHFERALAEVEAATQEELHRLATAYLEPDSALIVAAGPASILAPQLAGLGAIEVIAPE